jgi:DNA-binding transcriptional regulator YdaS (Cro superfamily)
MVKDLKTRVKQWLKDQRQSREWLADRCGVTKKTVDNWLSSPQVIPSKAVLIIERLMEATVEPEAAVPDSVLVLRVDDERFDAYSAASLAEGLPLREWAIHALDEAAAEQGQAPDRTGSDVAPDPIEPLPSPTVGSAGESGAA